jgi:hypothetical protein
VPRKELPTIYFVFTQETSGLFASRKGARAALEPEFQKRWAEANDPNHKQYDFVWAKRYRELGERAARNSFMRAAIEYADIQP